MKFPAKAAGSGFVGLILGVGLAMVGGDSFDDIAARLKGEESNVVLGVRFVRHMCAYPSAQRISEIDLINTELAADEQGISTPWCSPEEQAEGPVDSAEVEETAAEVVEQAETKAKEAAEAVEATITQDQKE